MFPLKFHFLENYCGFLLPKCPMVLCLCVLVGISPGAETGKRGFALPSPQKRSDNGF